MLAYIGALKLLLPTLHNRKGIGVNSGQLITAKVNINQG